MSEPTHEAVIEEMAKVMRVDTEETMAPPAWSREALDSLILAAALTSDSPETCARTISLMAFMLGASAAHKGWDTELVPA